MDAAEFVEVGTKIMQYGSELKALRVEREKLNSSIAELETKLQPLLIRHSELVAMMVGGSLPVPVAPPSVATTAVASPPASLPIPMSADERANSSVERKKIAARIMKLIENAEGNLSSIEIAEKLQVDGVLVREIMRELRDRR